MVAFKQAALILQFILAVLLICYGVMFTSQQLPKSLRISSSRIPMMQEQCPLIPVGLTGPILVEMGEVSEGQVEVNQGFLSPGGHGYPKWCRARHKVAIIIPYKDRESHLMILLNNLIPLLTKHQLDFRIFIVEPIGNSTFNRAKLMNIGTAEANKMYTWNCFIFHDVDLIPEDDRNIYNCPVSPRHLCAAIDKFDYRLPYITSFGGVSAIRKDHFEAMNGFSNDYWGWGGEDDDAYYRVLFINQSVIRRPGEIARYKMIKHVNDAINRINPCREQLLKWTPKRWETDGLNSLEYKTVSIEEKKLYTHIKVDLLESETRHKIPIEIVTACASVPI